MTPIRLFDCIEYQLQHTPKEDMFAAKIDGGIWKKYSTQEVRETVDKLSAGLINMHIGPNDGSVEGRDKIAVLSNNRPEWLILDLAVQQIGAVLTPIYPTISIQELEFVLNDAAVKLVFVSNHEMFDKVMSIRSKVPSVKAIFSFDSFQPALNWKEILLKGTAENMEQMEMMRDGVKATDLCTIIYTSGTTGTPKGVMLTHQNILSNVMNSKEIFEPIVNTPNERALSFLPLNHIFERMVSYIYMYSGCSIYYAESMDTIGDNLREVKPTVFSTVPRLLEKVYERIMNKGQELTGVKKKLFFWAVSRLNNSISIDL